MVSLSMGGVLFWCKGYIQCKMALSVLQGWLLSNSHHPQKLHKMGDMTNICIYIYIYIRIHAHIGTLDCE
jgi:hypothetical protein